MCLWILIIAKLALPSLSKKDQLYHQLSSDIIKEERIIGGSFVSAVRVVYLLPFIAIALFYCLNFLSLQYVFYYTDAGGRG